MSKELLAAVHAALAAMSSRKMSEAEAAIWQEIAREAANPHRRGDPVAKRKAWMQAADLMERVHGNEALPAARMLEERSTGTFPRLVTRLLEMRRREAKRFTED